MKKFTIILLLLSLCIVTLALTSCDASESDDFTQKVIYTVLGEDNAFSQQMSSITFFMNTKVYVERFMGVVNWIGNVLDNFNPNNIFSIILTGLVVFANILAWIVSLVVYGACILFTGVFDLIFVLLYALAFLLLSIVYLFNSFLLWLA